MSQNAKIYLRTKDVIDFVDSKSISPQHSYLVAEYYGKQYILRAGPGGKNPFGQGGNPLIGDLEFIGANNLVEYLPTNSVTTHYDWDFDKSHSSREIFSGSDQEVAQKFDILRELARNINEQHFDYRWNNQNCNTAMSYILHGADIDVNMENLYDANNNLLWMVGSDGIFLYNQPKNIDQSINSFFEYLKGINYDDIKVKLNHSFNIQKEPFIKILTDNGELRTDAVYVDEDGNLINYNQILYSFTNNDGKAISFIRDDTYIKNDDGSKTKVSSVIDAFKNSIKYTKEYLESKVEDLTKQYSDPNEIASLIIDINQGLSRGLSLREIAEITATKNTVKDLMAKGQNLLLFSGDDYDKIMAEDFNQISIEGKQTLELIKSSSSYKIAYMALVSFVTEFVLNRGDFNAQEYAFYTINSLAQASASVAIEEAFKTSLLRHAPYSEALSSGLGYGVSQLITSAIVDYFADDRMNSHQWQSSIARAGVVASAAGVGSALASAMFVGASAGPIGSAIAVILVYGFMGGRQLNQGEYFDKISFYNSILARNGIDTNFYALDNRGTAIIGSKYYNDNIYGNSGDDILIGGNGTNIINGGGGNDQIFGKGDNDIIFGNNGNDEITAGAGDDYVFGGDDADIIFGLNGDDIIYGDEIEISGENIINAIENYDKDLSLNSDLIQGGAGDDTLFGQGGDDIIFGNQDDDIILGGGGDDIIIGGTGFNNIKGGDSNDIIYAGNYGDNIDGESGDDEIYGGKGSDIIYGGKGNDIIDGNLGEDLIFGGFGDDIIYAGDEEVFVNNFGNYFQNSIHGEFGNDYLIGSNFNDIISDGDGEDIIYGGAGNDNIILGLGNNYLYFNKGDGADLIEIYLEDGEYFKQDYGKNIINFNNFNLNQNSVNQIEIHKNINDLSINFLDENGNFLNDKIIIKNQFYSSSDSSKLLIKSLQFADDLSLDLSAINFNENGIANINLVNQVDVRVEVYNELLNAYLDQILLAKDLNKINFFKSENYENIFNQKLADIDSIGSESVNQIEWMSIKRKRNFLGGHYQVWREVRDVELESSGESATIVGNFWSEKIIGNQFTNQIKGGSGADRIEGFAGDDILFGGVGNDFIDGGDDDDLIIAGAGVDNIIGGAGNDEIYGNEGNDLIQDLVGQNLIFAGVGEDEIIVSNSGNQIFGEAGDDRIYVSSQGSSADFTADVKALGANVATNGNIVYANFGNDSILGGIYNDYIFGQNGADYIEGKAGDDYLSGGEGNDKILGNEGNDKIFGDTGNDFIEAGDGDDLVWGGSGFDYINDGDGNDLVRAGIGDDEIRDGEGDDRIFGEAGDDLIRLQLGNNYAFGGAGNDIIRGGIGNDIIYGDDGFDIIFDGAGDDVITSGKGLDLIVIEAIKNSNNSTDLITDFDKINDRIIVKLNLKDNINFQQILSNAREVDNNLEINIGNNQKIILQNTKINDLNNLNLQIGYSVNADTKILYGENSSKILFGNDLDNKIYGSNLNDELFGGEGYDDLYGMGGDDILHYEVDDKFIKSIQEIYSDEIGYYHSFESLFSKNLIGIPPTPEYYNYKPQNHITNITNSTQKNIFESGYDLTNIQKISQYAIPIPASRVQYEPFRSSKYLFLNSVDKIDFLYNKNHHFATTNFYSNKDFEISGLNRSYDNFDGGEGFNSLFMTNGSDFLSFDDNNNFSNLRIKSIEAIFAFAGDDVINFSSPIFVANDIKVNGGLGDDKLWLGGGNDLILGDDGNDEIYGGAGEDIINGGVGDDIIFGGDGDDKINGFYGRDKIFGDAGNDIILVGKDNVEISGGLGSDVFDFSNLNNSLNINLEQNVVGVYESNNLNIGQISQIIVNQAENIIAGNFNDEIIGDNLNNIFDARDGNDIIFGKAGDDIYYFRNNHGNDKIYEDGLDVDTIKFAKDVSVSDLYLQRIDNDLIIYTDNNNSNQIRVVDQFKDAPKIDIIEFYDGNKITIPHSLVIIQQDNELLLDEEFFNINFNYKKSLKDLTFNARNIEFIFNQLASQIILKNNFTDNNFVEVEISDSNDFQGKMLIYYNRVNHAPTGFIDNFYYKVNQQANIAFSEYFRDQDGDKLYYELNLENYNQLPSWIKFNNQTGELELSQTRNGNYIFNLKVVDEDGMKIEQIFKMSFGRDLALDIANIENKNQIRGDLAKNKIYAKMLSDDVLFGLEGDDEIFYLEDYKWQNDLNTNFKAWNPYSGDEIDIVNKIRSDDCFDGGAGYDILNLTSKDDALFLDDQSISVFGKVSKISDIEEIRGNEGDDLIDLSSREYSYGDIKIYGGIGDDILWSNIGNDELYGEEGNDNIQGGAGDDLIIGGAGDDILKGYVGNDVIAGGFGADNMFGGDGYDIFLFEDFADSNKDAMDLIKDFDPNFDKIGLRGLNFSDIKYFDALIANENQSPNLLFYKFDDNSNVIIFNENNNFSFAIEGFNYLNNDNFLYN